METGTSLTPRLGTSHITVRSPFAPAPGSMSAAGPVGVVFSTLGAIGSSVDGLDSTVRDRLRELPPSAKLVFYVLAQQQPLTQSAIVEETLLSKRTVRDALGRLESAGLVESELYIHDARRNLYSLTVSTSRD